MSNINIKRKSIKKGLQFTLMVVGQSGLGKSTFVNTLVGDKLFPNRRPCTEKTIVPISYDIDIEEGSLHFSDLFASNNHLRRS